MSLHAEFTGKERDAETGLDYFQARYFSSAQGRFTSPDEWTATGGLSILGTAAVLGTTNIAKDAVKQSGEFTQQLTNGQSFVRQGQAAGDLSKVAKGQRILSEANAGITKRAGDPAGKGVQALQTVGVEAAKQARSQSKQHD